jgi:hypothetical protein
MVLHRCGAGAPISPYLNLKFLTLRAGEESDVELTGGHCRLFSPFVNSPHSDA